MSGQFATTPWRNQTGDGWSSALGGAVAVASPAGGGGSSGGGGGSSGGGGGGSSGGGGGGSSGGGGGGSSGGGGSGGSGGSNCLLFGTLVRLADGRVTPIENLKPGDSVATIKVPGLEVDVPFRAQYQWLSHHGMRGTIPTVGRVASVKLGEHTGFVVINRRIKATPEHPFLMRRGDDWGFSSAEFIKKGDYLIGERLAEELVETVDRIEAPTRTVAIHIPSTNTFSAEGVWVHNDMPATAQSSGSGVSSSGSGSGSGSGSSSSSGSPSGSGKSSGSSMSSSSGSGSGSGSGSSSSGTGSYSI